MLRRRYCLIVLFVIFVTMFNWLAWVNIPSHKHRHVAADLSQQEPVRELKHLRDNQQQQITDPPVLTLMKAASTEQLTTKPVTMKSEEKPAKVYYEFNTTVWKAGDTLETMIAREVDQKYWGPIPQSLSMKQATGCDVFTVPFDIKTDERCVNYLSDRANWAELTPLNQEYDERTIKLQFKYNNQPFIKAMIKVPQRLFPSEPHSEIAAYHADRILGINRVPPTAWVCIPEDMIRKALKVHGKDVGTVDEFLKESDVKDYASWVEKDFFEFANEMNMFRIDPTSGEKCYTASVQLVVAEAVHFLDSIYAIPYKPHDASWHNYFDLNNDKEFPTRLQIPLIHISELTMFDFVTGNDDRSPNKNNFVVGGCKPGKHHSDCGKNFLGLKHAGHPTFVHLDQGMSFVHRPKRNALGKKDSTFCIFSTPLLNRFAQLVEAARDHDKQFSFTAQLLRRLPSHDHMMSYFISTKVLKGVENRMKEVVERADKCIEDFGAEYVLTP